MVLEVKTYTLPLVGEVISRKPLRGKPSSSLRFVPSASELVTALSISENEAQPIIRVVEWDLDAGEAVVDVEMDTIHHDMFVVWLASPGNMTALKAGRTLIDTSPQDHRGVGKVASTVRRLTK